ncbi:DsbA family protein [Mariprofundus micogutta]|nr:DsbA family protein [Mariprofundus micogutta]
MHDPMCSWCWAFRPVWDDVRQQMPDSMEVKYLLGGLAPDSDLLMSAETRSMIRRHWQVIEKKVPGTRFNYDFWSRCDPRRSTYPACRAVIAAKNQNPMLEDAMIQAIQHAYYLNARNPSDDEILIDLAYSLSLDVSRFKNDLHGADTQAELMSEIRTASNMGCTGFPGLILEDRGAFRHIRIDYSDAGMMLQQLSSVQAL